MGVGVPLEIVDTIPNDVMLEITPGRKFPCIVNE